MFVIFVMVLLAPYILSSLTCFNDYGFANVTWSSRLDNAFSIRWQGPWSWPWLSLLPERDASVAHPPTEGHDLTMAFLVDEMRCSARAMVSAMTFPALRCLLLQNVPFLIFPFRLRTF